MALASIFLGGFVGFATFLLALLKFEASVLTALGLYSVSGTAMTLLMLLSFLLISTFQQKMQGASKHEDLTPAGF